MCTVQCLAASAHCPQHVAHNMHASADAAAIPGPALHATSQHLGLYACTKPCRTPACSNNLFTATENTTDNSHRAQGRHDALTDYAVLAYFASFDQHGPNQLTPCSLPKNL